MVSAKSGAAAALWSSLNFSRYLWNRNMQCIAPSDCNCCWPQGHPICTPEQRLILSLKNAPSSFPPPQNPQLKHSLDLHTVAWVSETSISTSLGWRWQARSMLPSLPSNLRSPPSSLLSPLQSTAACIHFFRKRLIQMVLKCESPAEGWLPQAARHAWLSANIWSAFSGSADTPRDPNSRTLDKLYSRVNKCLKKRRQERHPENV